MRGAGISVLLSPIVFVLWSVVAFGTGVVLRRIHALRGTVIAALVMSISLFMAILAAALPESVAERFHAFVSVSIGFALVIGVPAAAWWMVVRRAL